MKRLIDTNVLIDETLEDSDRHEEACKLVDSSQRALLLRTVLLEYIWVMLKKVDAPPEFVMRKVEEYYLKFTPYCEKLTDIRLALSLLPKKGLLLGCSTTSSYWRARRTTGSSS